MSMTTIPAWINAIEEIHTPVYRFQNIRRCSYSHQIGWFVLRKMWNGHIQNVIHFLMTFTNSQTAHSITVQIHLADTFCMVDTDIIKNRTLINTKEHLILIDRILQTVQPLHFFLAAFQPACRTVYGWLHIISISQGRRTFIKCHSNSRTEIGLNLHTFFRSHKDFTSVYMRMKLHTLFFDFP